MEECSVLWRNVLCFINILENMFYFIFNVLYECKGVR